MFSYIFIYIHKNLSTKTGSTIEKDKETLKRAYLKRAYNYVNVNVMNSKVQKVMSE